MGLLLRAFLALFGVYVLARLFRGAAGPVPRHRRDGLDPSRAVRASWSEVEEARKEEPGER